MSKPYVTVSGNFLTTNLRRMLESSIEDKLEVFGEIATEVMRDNMWHKDDTNRLRNSVMWRTRRAQSGTNSQNDLIDRPTLDGVLLVGSAAPNASYIEYGTPAHVTSENWEEFIKNIMEWGARKGIPADEMYPIIRSIREHGTRSYPYAKQTYVDLRPLINKLGREIVMSFVEKFKYRAKGSA